MISSVQTPTLMLIYGAGFTAISLLFYFMYTNALKYSKELKLTETEIFATRTQMIMNLLVALIGVGAIIFAYALPLEYAGLSGFFYMLIPLAYTIWLGYRGKKGRKQFGVNAPHVS